MSEQVTTQSKDIETEIQERKDNIYRSYNYVGTKETIAYLFNDWSNTFNIGGFNTRYIWDVVKIDFGVSAIVNLFTGAWDVINDLLFAGIVDNTRTRIGKFRPYLVMMQIPLSLIGLLYWFLPYFFPNTAGTYVPKLIFYFIFNIITETAGTFTGLARGGYMSTITPNPNERVRLITLAELLTGYMGEDMPAYVMGFLYDMVSTGRWAIKMRSIFMGMGVGCAVISSAFTFWFFLQSKERVPQTVDKPNIKEGMKAVLTNYPVLLMCLSDFLGGFGVGTDEANYWIDVHGNTHMINTLKALVSGISGPVGSISYAFVAPLRKRFSSRFIWVGSDFYGDMVTLGFFAFGMYKKNYLKVWPMLVAYGIREFLVKLLFGVNKVINADLWNQAMDFCEWKNGYRMEATTSVAKNLVLKLQGIGMNSIRLMVMKKIGYVQGAKSGTQDERTKFWLFALCTVVPFVTSILGIVPKLLWPLSKARETQMYYELAQMRDKRINAYVEDLEAKAQESEA
ncbi:MAG: MFS transporter [Clostridia bacterium]|nr:MFS transporter [Clostridia bacterium]